MVVLSFIGKPGRVLMNSMVKDEEHALLYMGYGDLKETKGTFEDCI